MTTKPTPAHRTAEEIMVMLDDSIGEVEIGYSKFINQWYASGAFDEGGDGFTRSIAGHGSNSDEALFALFSKLVSIQAPQYIVTNASDKLRRKHWRWRNGKFELVKEETRQNWEIEVSLRAVIRVVKLRPIPAAEAIQWAEKLITEDLGSDVEGEIDFQSVRALK